MKSAFYNYALAAASLFIAFFLVSCVADPFGIYDTAKEEKEDSENSSSSVEQSSSSEAIPEKISAEYYANSGDVIISYPPIEDATSYEVSYFQSYEELDTASTVLAALAYTKDGETATYKYTSGADTDNLAGWSGNGWAYFKIVPIKESGAVTSLTFYAHTKIGE